jgi:adenosylhomocysteinase
MDGHQVLTMQEAVKQANIVVTATGNKNVVTSEHFVEMNHNTIVCNIGHFDNEIDVNWLECFCPKINVKPQCDIYEIDRERSIILLAEGRLVNLGCATGHPSFVMSCSFTNQVLAQIEIFKNSEKYQRKVYTLPKHLDEEVARLHLNHVGARLETLTQEQSDYIGVSINGPYKSEDYRY